MISFLFLQVLLLEILLLILSLINKIVSSYMSLILSMFVFLFNYTKTIIIDISTDNILFIFSLNLPCYILVLYLVFIGRVILGFIKSY